VSGHEVVVTRGGARAMRDRASGEVMHPVVGPRIEAELLYLGPSRLADRLAVESPLPLNLFDVGLGAGSNAIAAWRLSEGRGHGRRLHIVSFERDLGAFRQALEASHADAFGLDGDAGAAARLLLDRGRVDGARTSWRLVLGELPGSLILDPDVGDPPLADVVFWDPFSPRANPTLWTMAAFVALRRRCAPRATVHTFSAATASRAALVLAGFAVGVGDATGAKEHTTVAAVEPGDLERPLDARWLDRLRRSSAPLPLDAPPDALDRIARAPQFLPSPHATR
jgi:queuine tRNA-ribosyltransferase